MPHNNPEKDLADGGNTVFIDASALGELSSQLTPQELETLVGFNIQAADFEALEDVQESHVVDPSGVLLSDGVAVGNIVEVAGGGGGVVDDPQQLEAHDQPMEVDALNDQAQVIGEMEMLQHGGDLIAMGGEELTTTSGTSTAALLATASTVTSDTSSHHIEAPQILKSGLGQFVVLQQNQNSISLSTLSNRIISSGGHITTMAGIGNNSSNKPVVVNTSQLGGSLRTHPVVVTQPLVQTPQIRTMQIKPAPQSQSQNCATVTKVIITSQAGGSLGGQQLRLVTSQNSGTTQVTPSPTKLTLQQAQQLGFLGLSPSKSVAQSPNKIVVQRVSMASSSPVKSPTKVMMPISMSMKSPTKIAPAPPHGQPQIITQQISSSGAIRNILSSPQKIVIKSNVPQVGQGTVSTVRPGQILSGGQQVIKIPANQVQQLTGQAQNIQILSNKMNYVRLVNPGIGGGGGGGGGATTLIKQTPQVNKPIAPASSQPIKIKAMPIAPNQQVNKQRVIIPVSGTLTGSNVSTGVSLPNRSASLTLPASALPPGVLSNTQPGSVVMIPAHYMSQLQQSSTTNTTTVQMSSQAPPGTIIQQPPKPQPPRNLIDANGIRPRKPCNCTKSQCLKLYCDCFANGEFCNNCNCANCFNNLGHEEDRQKAIKACLDRNPQAFRPKIGKGGSDNERRHNKGCNCKRSGCLKNYCECYEAKIPCSSICKCVGCKNIDINPAVERKGLMQLAECAEARVNQQNAVKSKLPSLSHHSPSKMFLPSAKSGCYRVNQEVVEATCQCLLAQADKAENALVSDAQIELSVISEFSRCLMQIIGSYTSRSRGLGDS